MKNQYLRETVRDIPLANVFLSSIVISPKVLISAFLPKEYIKSLFIIVSS